MTISHRFLPCAAMLLGLLLVTFDSEARRIGGGRTSGVSRPVATKTEAVKPEAAAKTRSAAEESSGSTINVRVRSSDSNSSGSAAASNAAPAQAAAPASQRASAAVPVPQPAVDDEELRRRSDDNLRRQAEADERIRLEKEKRAAAIAAWEEYQAKQRELLEKERAEKQARNRARESASPCVYKPVMSDEDLERCRQASR